jgi:hypothetical protein
MKNKLDLVQMDLPEKHKTIEDTFLIESLLDSSKKIDDIYDTLLEEEKKTFLRWLELEFLHKLLVVKKSNERLVSDFGKPGQLFPNGDANNIKIDYLEDWIKEKKASLVNTKLNETEGKLASVGSYLGQPTNDLANNLFDFLILNYRPNQKTKVKYINILHYLKNDSNKELYVFNVKQVDYIKMIKEKTGIQIKKFQKSERYLAIEKPVLNALEVTFRT